MSHLSSQSMSRRELEAEWKVVLLAYVFQSQWGIERLPPEPAKFRNNQSAERQRKYQFMLAAEERVESNLHLLLLDEDGDFRRVWEKGRLLLEGEPFAITEAEASFMRDAVHETAASAESYRRRKWRRMRSAA